MTSITINDTTGRTIPAPEGNFNQTWWDQFKHIADKDIMVGDPATYSVGSDSYSAVVTEVVRFKEGKRAGQVKYVKLDDRNKMLAYPIICRDHKTPKIELVKGVTVETPWGGSFVSIDPICTQCWLQHHGALQFQESADAYWSRARIGSQNPYQDPHF
jgi:hypothetical protein